MEDIDIADPAFSLSSAFQEPVQELTEVFVEAAADIADAAAPAFTIVSGDPLPPLVSSSADNTSFQMLVALLLLGLGAALFFFFFRKKPAGIEELQTLQEPSSVERQRHQ